MWELLTVTELEITVPDPLVILEKFFIFALKTFPEIFKVNSLSSVDSNSSVTFANVSMTEFLSELLSVTKVALVCINTVVSSSVIH